MDNEGTNRRGLPRNSDLIDNCYRAKLMMVGVSVNHLCFHAMHHNRVKPHKRKRGAEMEAYDPRDEGVRPSVECPECRADITCSLWGHKQIKELHGRVWWIHRVLRLRENKAIRNFTPCQLFLERKTCWWDNEESRALGFCCPYFHESVASLETRKAAAQAEAEAKAEAERDKDLRLQELADDDRTVSTNYSDFDRLDAKAAKFGYEA